MRVTAWEWKQCFLVKPCDGRMSKARNSHLRATPEHILVQGSALTCMGCGGEGSTQRTKYFITRHAECEAVWRECS
eukprot:615706-Amphidinium_carterae.1